MKRSKSFQRLSLIFSKIVVLLALSLAFVACTSGSTAYGDGAASTLSVPVPLLKEDGKAVDWWFVFKFNAKSFPGCANDAVRSCPFGGEVQNYRVGFSQQYVYASSVDANLESGSGCVGDSNEDPVASTYEEIYSGNYNYVIWNDQFYGDPMKTKLSPWGHSKGALVWNDAGEGFVMQVSTPSWPGSGSASFPRKTDGNTLGCVTDDDVEVSQHFFALKLNDSDVVAVLKALQNASVVTDPSNPQLVHNGGPDEIKQLVTQLGKRSHSKTYTAVTLSTGVGLISKPSDLHVPPWQLVSASLNGVPLRTATWWAAPKIPSTKASTKISCWNSSLGQPGAVEIATTGHWQHSKFSLRGGLGRDRNHAKVGISTNADAKFAIFGDLNQQGVLSGKCARSNNGRGGMFYVVPNKALNHSIAALIH